MKKLLFDLLRSFSRHTTVHGLHIIGLPKLHYLERIFWLAVITVATGGAIAITYSNWIRYTANPTVVSLQKDFRNWLNPFPAATGCFVTKVDNEKADNFIQKNWGINSSHASYGRYMDFIKVVSNVSYQNLHEFSKFLDDESFQTVDMLDMSIKVHPDLSGTLVTFDNSQKTYWSLIMSELGLCFSVNSKFVGFFSITKNSLENPKILRCHYLNGLCYARFDSDPQQPIKYYVHSYLEVVHATVRPPLVVHESEELEINYRMQETDSAVSLRDLSPKQRKCQFYDEPLWSEIPVYSTGICYMMCRYKLALKLCGCRPFFYHRFKGKLCDLAGLLCLAKHSEHITRPPSQINCNCPEPCDMITYFPQVPKVTKWEYGYFDQRITFRWALLAPTTKFHRDILFGFEDLVVSLGGTLVLFLGISFISVIELIFLLAENLYLSYKGNKTRIVPPRKILVS